MDTAADMTERHRRILARLAEMGMAQAEQLHAAVVAEPVPERAAELSAAFHRISRSVRQTLALEARLERERRMLPLQAARAEREDAIERGRRRRTELQERVRRLIWTEAERPERERLGARLSDLLANAHQFEGFADLPLDEHIARIAHEIGLPRSGLSIAPPQPAGPDDDARRGPPDAASLRAILAEIKAEADACATHVPGLAETLARAERLAAGRLNSS